MSADRKRQARAHAARIEPNRLIDERANPGEVADCRHAPQEFRPRQTQHRARDQDVLAAGDLAHKAGSQRQDRCDPAINFELAAGRLGDAAEKLQQGGLASTIMPDYADALAARDLEADVAQHPVFLVKAPKTAECHLFQPVRAPGIELIGLAKPGAADRDVR